MRRLEEDIQYTRYHLYHHRFLTTYYLPKRLLTHSFTPLLTYVYWPSALCLSLYEKLKIMQQMQPSSHLWYLIVKPKCHGIGKKKCTNAFSNCPKWRAWRTLRERESMSGRSSEGPVHLEGFLYRWPVSELPWDMQPAPFSLTELDIRGR